MIKKKNKSPETISLNKEEVKTILECLLFSSSVDVCASWYQEDTKKMLELAERFRYQFNDVPIENVYMTHFNEDKDLFMEKYSKRIIKSFPEIEHVSKEKI